MAIKIHLGLLLLSFITWGLFFLIGLPDYYQSWPMWIKVLILPAVTWLYLPSGRWQIRQLIPYTRNGSAMAAALWLAFYLTVPLCVYDVVVIMGLWGEDIGFLWRYFYLSFFYVSFWVQFPWIAKRMTSTNGV